MFDEYGNKGNDFLTLNLNAFQQWLSEAGETFVEGLEALTWRTWCTTKGCLHFVTEIFYGVCLTLGILSFILICVEVAGAAAAVVAGLLLDRNREYGALLGGGVFTLPLVVLFIGVGLLLLGSPRLGRSPPRQCLSPVHGLQLVAVATESVGVTLVLVYKERTEKAVQRAMSGVFHSYGDEDNLAITFSLDRAQHKLQCCGVLSFVEWGNTTFGAEYGVPDGCCRTMTEGCGQGILLRPETSAKQTIYTRGCYTAVRKQVVRGASAIIAMLVTFVLVQFMCAYYAFSAARKLRMVVAPAS
ncbi:hypothetical protein O3P69_008180 [Scylla paramamosain]|uniref:Tetraspanin n=1 Tax=Scylla paramamosain TaxID=85552 RepID=A0AAW0T0Q7_SCYPA